VELSFSYRTSIFQHTPGVILAATFCLTPAADAREKQIKLFSYRKETQPYGDKSAGCVFRNPKCGHAGALIEKSGLKGYRLGGAQISDKHANFIVNANHSTAHDVLELIKLTKERVKEMTGFELESEVRFVPYEPQEALK
jgi:UDP-N-acetylmuramate dehydrogenase